MAHRFRPRWLPTLAVVALLPLFIAAGVWQLDRAGQKQRLQAEYDARANAAPLALTGEPRAAEDLRFYKVIARGVYEPDYQILIDNRVHRGQAGYYVITPLRIADSATRVLVNRGWVPLGGDRATLPETPAPVGVQEAVGIATVPSEHPFTLGSVEDPRGVWPKLWQHLDLERYRQRVPFTLQPVVILLDPAANGGFVRQWARLDAGIATHRGYAFQWFSLAIALLAVYFFVNVRNVSAHKGNDKT